MHSRALGARGQQLGAGAGPLADDRGGVGGEPFGLVNWTCDGSLAWIDTAVAAQSGASVCATNFKRQPREC